MINTNHWQIPNLVSVFDLNVIFILIHYLRLAPPIVHDMAVAGTGVCSPRRAHSHQPSVDVVELVLPVHVVQVTLLFGGRWFSWTPLAQENNYDESNQD